MIHNNNKTSSVWNMRKLELRNKHLNNINQGDPHFDLALITVFIICFLSSCRSTVVLLVMYKVTYTLYIGLQEDSDNNDVEQNNDQEIEDASKGSSAENEAENMLSLKTRITMT